MSISTAIILCITSIGLRVGLWVAQRRTIGDQLFMLNEYEYRYTVLAVKRMITLNIVAMACSVLTGDGVYLSGTVQAEQKTGIVIMLSGLLMIVVGLSHAFALRKLLNWHRDNA